jgi:hypothetical protein
MVEALPRLRCPQRVLGELTADPEAPCWRGVASGSFVNAITAAAPLQSTEVRAAWDAGEMRVLFQVADTDIHATLTERDAPLYTEEVVEVFLDPVGDLESYFEIEVNPLNAVLDLVLRRNRSGYRKDVAWDCEGLRTCVRRTAAGWNAEISIPFRSVVLEPPQRGAEWRVNFTRIDRPPGVERELTAWSPTGFANFHVPERFGILEFAE